MHFMRVLFLRLSLEQVHTSSPIILELESYLNTSRNNNECCDIKDKFIIPYLEVELINLMIFKVSNQTKCIINNYQKSKSIMIHILQSQKSNIKFVRGSAHQKISFEVNLLKLEHKYINDRARDLDLYNLYS